MQISYQIPKFALLFILLIIKQFYYEQNFTLNSHYCFHAISSFSFAQKQVVISSEELQGPTAGKDISINKDGITITMSYGAMNNKFSYRLYQKATMTITSANYNMTNIIIECDTHESGGKRFLADGFADNMEGVTVSSDKVTVTWTGDTKTTSFTAAKKQVRIKKFTITLKDTPNDITGINVESSNNAQPMYNLSGQRVDKNYKGVVIQNGKKFINK